MNFSIIVSILLLFYFNANAQNIRVIYNFRHVIDLKNTSNVKNEKFSLYISRNRSIFRSYDREMIDSQFLVTRSNTASGSVAVNLQIKPTTSERLYIFISNGNKELWRTTRYASTNFAMKLQMPIIVWNILPKEKKIFLGRSCLKATTRFGGRNYTAWFNTDFKTNIGPYKFNGLPGLILDIRDDKNEIIFTATSIEEIKQPFETTVPKDYSVVSLKDYERLVKSGQQMPVNSSKSEYKIEGVHIQGSNMGGTKKARPIANPIELE